MGWHIVVDNFGPFVALGRCCFCLCVRVNRILYHGGSKDQREGHEADVWAMQ